MNEKIEADVEQLKKEIWFLKNNSSSGESQGEGSGGASGDISEITEAISDIEDRLDDAEDDIDDIQASLNIGENIDVIYDMRSNDENINRTWTTGATYGKMIRIDFTAYTSLRVYASINGCEVQKVIKVAERKKSDFCVLAINSTFSEICFLRFALSINGSAFQVGQYGIFTFDYNTNTFFGRKGSTNPDVYMYRLEGIK